ncbi:MAG: pyridoxal-phosphate dependent enzyme [Bacteroidetes bacterium]|nr:pyridoxal-phosphate dependent enzyme [Bacteroidota bacterium]
MRLPSPEEEIKLPLFGEAGIEVFIKRDDLIHPFISGNKWRKLMPLVELAKARKLNTMKSYGGAWSNHLLALAAAGASNGLKTIGIVRGEVVANPLLNLCRQFGMDLQFLDRQSYREVRSQLDMLYSDGDILTIPEGANCEEGRMGMAGLWKELCHEYDILLDSVGSGTSVQGLVQTNPGNTKVWGVMAVKDAALASRLESMGIRVFREYSRGGFARMDQKLIEACRAFTEKSGILLDPVYTGKQWMALLDLLENGRIERGSRILFVHSGGLAGWMSDRANALG